MGDLPLAYKQVKLMLLRQLGHAWLPGMRLPSSADLAKKLGTGQRNTHRAMAELAAEGLLVSRRGKGTFVSQDIEQLLQSQRAGGVLAGRTVGILVRVPVPDEFIDRMARAISEPLEAAGATTVRAVYHGLLNKLTDEQYSDMDAIVMINPDKSPPITIAAGKPTVAISTTADLTMLAAGGYDLVAADDQQGGYLAGEALRRAGCRRVCFLGVAERPAREVYLRTSEARLRGLEAGLGATIEPACRFKCTSYMPGAGGRVVANFMQLDPRPDGVFAASDELAIGFAIGAAAMGLEPGRDYKLVGFDGQDVVRHPQEFSPITTVAVPIAEMGRRGAELLTHRLIQPDRPAQRLQLSCELFEGSTCQAVDVRTSV